ncbi:exonuclease domain-containing protein [Actinospica sp.]|jgi:DNA polymerase-3 subunit epsilon|uniref:exonuclease domain-containing protein n=1 Tax=Actinospica sp. TaxID=1872142 RepID=UPI002C26E60D|nr:exonuclease domain-containing protein [Actinospica sp.]HWG28019.1 exonuclease domain-containing protein [Actinospica sp.]
MATNRFPGSCKTCGTQVLAEEGELRKEQGAWVVYHPNCLPAPVPGWHTGVLGSYDCETTGRDPLTARLVSAAFVTSDGRRYDFLVDPGVPIPPETTAVHGITDEQVREHGTDPAEALDRIAELLAAHLSAGLPLIVFNAPYDLTLLEVELERHGLRPLVARAGRIEPVIDPLVIDKAVDRFRKGKRNLESQCAHYGVRIEGAHDAAVDAIAALEVAKALAERYPEVGEATPLELHRQQEQWKAASEEDFAAYRLRRGEAYVAEPGWPVRQRPGADEAAVPGFAEMPDVPGALF